MEKIEATVNNITTGNLGTLKESSADQSSGSNYNSPKAERVAIILQNETAGDSGDPHPECRSFA